MISKKYSFNFSSLVIKNIYLSVILFFYSNINYADTYEHYSDDAILDIGESARNMTTALMGISDLWLSIATIAGIGFLFASMIKYHTHRKNPQQGR